MRLTRMIVFYYLRVQYLFHQLTGRGAFGRREAEIIEGPIQTHDNALKSALLQHHVKQYNEASCSVATVVAVVNALLEVRGRTSETIGQLDILEKVRTANWKERMSEKGDNGRRGLPLPLLEEILKSSLNAYGVGTPAVELLQAHRDPVPSRKVKAALWQRLREFETRGDCLIIAHFDQGVYLRTLHIPHISPVGAFDLQTAMVTMLDVDPEVPKPYQIPFDTFYRGLCADYNGLFKKFGYGSGGCLVVKTGPG